MKMMVAVLLSIGLGSAPAAAAEASGALTVRLEGFKSDDGKVALAIWNDEQYWLSDGNTVRDTFTGIDNGVAVIVFDDLPYGEYAISVYHDKNGNGKLDTGMFRIPKEPIGTSNDARIRFGPPKYDDARFMLDQPALSITIPVRKLF